MAVDGLLSLRWNNHSSSFLKQLSFLRDKETYSDLTLVCGGQFYQVHRLVVSGCSEYFRAILEHTPCRHPAVVLQDLPPRHLEALLSYMYLGQVSVPQDQLGGLIRAAECLAIKGLAVPDEATPTPTPPPHQDARGRPTPAWEDGPPPPKRRRQDRGEAGGSPGPPPHRGDSGRSSRSSSRGSSPQQVTPSATPHQNTSPEDTTPLIKVEEDREHPREVKCEVESMFEMPDPLGDTQHEGGPSEGDQATYTPTTASTTNSLLHQYPPHSQAFDQVVAQVLPGTSGMHEESGHGWDSGPGKGDLTTVPAFLMDSFSPQQEPLAPSHHTSLHQRGPGLSGWVNQGTSNTQQPLHTAHSTPPWPTTTTTAAGGDESGGANGGVHDDECCRFCGYKGQAPKHLKKHLRIHTGEKPFHCPACSYSSAQTSNLNGHIRRHHPALCQARGPLSSSRPVRDAVRRKGTCLQVRMPGVVSSPDEDYTPTTDDAPMIKKRGVKTGTKRGKYTKICAKDSATNIILKAAENDENWKAVAEANGIPIQTAYGWIRRSGEQRKKRGGRRFTKVGEEHVEMMIEYVREDPLITLQEISAKLALETGITVSTNTVHRHLEGQLYTVKKRLPEPAAMNTEENKQKRKVYVEKIMNRIGRGKTVIYVDETNANLFHRRSQGHARKGLHCMPECPTSEGQNIHILGSMSQHGLLYWERRRGSYKKEDCQEWLRRMLRTITEPLYNIVVVCDNAPVLSGIEYIAEEEEFMGVEIVRMSPYSAPLNPTGECWSVMKAAMKRDLAENSASLMDTPPDMTQTEHRIQSLERCIDNAVTNITPVLCLNTCNHVQKHFSGVMQMKDLDMGDN